MSHLIDTNVLSELWKLQSEPAVIAFLDSVEWFVPVSVSAEIQEGAEAAPSDKKKIDINARLDVFLRDHSKTMMDFDTEDARVWGRLKHSQEVKRQPQALWDSLIDAMAVRRQFIVITRNQKDFRHAATVNPWDLIQLP